MSFCFCFAPKQRKYSYTSSARQSSDADGGQALHRPSKAGSSELATEARATGIALQPVIDDCTTKGSHVQSDADIEDDTLSPSVVPRQERIEKLVEEACGRQECASAEILGPAGLNHLQVRLFWACTRLYTIYSLCKAIRSKLLCPSGRQRVQTMC